jgi:mannose-6-phosphate isomerase-like protein (cupin superfamily)
VTGKGKESLFMYKLLREQDFELRPGGTVRFEGEPHGSGASFFHAKSEPGKGSELHKHPYSETWVVRAGRVRFTVGKDQIEAEAGHVVVAGANIPHKYTNIGNDLLEFFCIHPSPKILQEAVEE